MTSHDREAFARCLYLLGAAFREDVSDLRADAYFLALQDVPIDAVERATRMALESCTFFPKPVELRRLLEGSREDRAELAWVEAMRLARSVGSYGTPVWDDPAMQAAIDALGGWRAFCLAEDDSLTYRATVFKRTYGAMATRVAVDRSLPAGHPFAGFLES